MQYNRTTKTSCSLQIEVNILLFSMLPLSIACHTSSLQFYSCHMHLNGSFVTVAEDFDILCSCCINVTFEE